MSYAAIPTPFTPSRSRPLIYIAHPLGQGPDREANRARASRWCAWAALHMNVAPVADWIILSGQWDETKRDVGLEIDVALVQRCDAVWLVGGRVSPGMAIEAAAARRAGQSAWDFTALGEEPPPNSVDPGDPRLVKLWGGAP